jgi:SAM-dependent methyltransferase
MECIEMIRRIREGLSKQEYLSWQSEKTDKHPGTVARMNNKAHDAIMNRMIDYVDRGKSMLCIGARLGGEVWAFRKMGWFAVGVDLNPGKQNKYVVFDDMERLSFCCDCVDGIYSNSLDHAHDLDVMLSEMHRVLKPDGIVLLDVVSGTSEGYSPQEYESVEWDNASDVLEYISPYFEITVSEEISEPFEGRFYAGTKKARS